MLQHHLVVTLTADAMPKAPGSTKTPVQTSFLLFSETPPHTEEAVPGFSTCSEAPSDLGLGSREPNTYVVAAFSNQPESDSRVGVFPTYLLVPRQRSGAMESEQASLEGEKGP